jgi:hypothetical protein
MEAKNGAKLKFCDPQENGNAKKGVSLCHLQFTIEPVRRTQKFGAKRVKIGAKHENLAPNSESKVTFCQRGCTEDAPGMHRR